MRTQLNKIKSNLEYPILLPTTIATHMKAFCGRHEVTDTMPILKYSVLSWIGTQPEPPRSAAIGLG